MNRLLAFSAMIAAIGLFQPASAETIISVTQFKYDVNQRPQCVAVRMKPDAFGAQADACLPGTAGTDGPDRITLTEYDAAGQVKKITSGYGVAPQVDKEVVEYTINGLEKIVADGKGNRTTYEYDGFDRLKKVRYPNAACCDSSTVDFEEYDYDPNGNRTSWRRRFETSPVTFTYDALNRANNGLRGEAYGYDNLGHRISATYGGQTASAAFDALGRLKSETTNGRPLSYEYDPAGHRTKITWPDTAPAFFVTYKYDAAGAMTEVRENDASLLATYRYDDLGRLKSLERPNGLTTSYGYDSSSRPTCLSHTVACPGQGGTWTFAYNAAGQVKTRIANDGRYEWSGSQASKTYTVNGLNQYDTVAGTTMVYDRRGNLANDGATTYVYDLLNNLTSAGTTSLAYEPSGRLWSVASGGATTQFLYSGPDIVAEMSPSGQILRRYVPGAGTDAPIVWYEGSGTGDRRWLLTDPQGSIVGVTSASGVEAWTNTYDEYGVPAAGNVGRFQYTGQAWIPEAGLYHYKARAYSPTLGRFLQTDPIGYGDGLNWYAYVGNDPLNRSDPTGQAAADCNPWGCTTPASPELRKAQADQRTEVRTNVEPVVNKEMAVYATAVVGTGVAIGVANVAVTGALARTAAAEVATGEAAGGATAGESAAATARPPRIGSNESPLAGTRPVVEHPVRSPGAPPAPRPGGAPATNPTTTGGKAMEVLRTAGSLAKIALQLLGGTW